MPYIPEYDRDFYRPDAPVAPNAGVLNFQITTLVNQFLITEVTGYHSYNAAIGALECAKLELYRRLVAPYEDVKIKENGDVYQ